MKPKITIALLMAIASGNTVVQAQSKTQKVKTEISTDNSNIAPAPPKQSENLTNDQKTFRNVDVKARPNYNFNQYLIDNIKYPQLAREKNIVGKVVVDFFIERDGSVSNVRVINGKELGYGLPEEAIRVIKNMPKWNPGLKDGKAVRCALSVPIQFNLRHSEQKEEIIK